MSRGLGDEYKTQLTLRACCLDEADLDEPGGDGVYLDGLVLRHLVPAVRGELLRATNVSSALSVGASLSARVLGNQLSDALNETSHQLFGAGHAAKA